MIAFVLLWSLPLVTMVFTSFKPDQEALTNPFGLPHTWSLDAYRYAWRTLGYKDLLWNSALYSVVGTALAILLVEFYSNISLTVSFSPGNALGDTDSAAANSSLRTYPVSVGSR